MEEKRQMHQNKRILNIFMAISLLFLSIIGYLSYFELFVKEEIITSSYNRRQWQREDNTLRGSISDRTGLVLAKSEIAEGRQERIYPYDNLYSHVIGYNSHTYGKSLLEAKFNDDLLNINPLNPILDLKDKLTGEQTAGNDLFLTIDHQLQSHADSLLGKSNGAVVAIDPKTGEILALISHPDFDPNRNSMEEDWSELVESEESVLLPRATQGLYVPGSTFKTAVSVMALEKGLGGLIYDDQGSIVIDGKKIINQGSKGHGEIGLTEALAFSSNVFFSQLGVELGESNLKSLADKVYLGKKIPFDLSVSTGRFDYQKMSETDMAAVGMGQGKILMSPLQMALLTAGIANDGVVMKPYLADRVRTANGYILKDRQPDVFFRLTSAEVAGQVQEMMRQVVVKGTGKNAAIPGIDVAGKTGTAENELTAEDPNKEHAWFIGFAPLEDPQIAVAVILEYSGSTGGSAAAPIARELMKDWLDR